MWQAERAGVRDVQGLSPQGMSEANPEQPDPKGNAQQLIWTLKHHGQPPQHRLSKNPQPCPPPPFSAFGYRGGVVALVLGLGVLFFTQLLKLFVGHVGGKRLPDNITE